jgi:hypothetical protein
MSRKRMLVDHGFRLPSAMDNRPLKWEEFLERIGQTVYLSATPGTTRWPSRATFGPSVEQIIRPTGLIDPRSSSSPPRVRSTTSSTRSGPGPPGRAGAGHDADQEDGRGPHRLPARQGDAGALPALRHRHPAAGRDCCASCGSASSTCWSASTCCARASTCPRCRWCHPRRRQGGLPALDPLAHPDHRPRRPQRERPGAYVCRQAHPLDARRHRRDQPPPEPSRSPTTPSTASTRSRCARRSPTSPTCSRRGGRRHPR